MVQNNSLLPTMTSRSRAILMLVVANVFWGLSFPLIKAIEQANERLVPDAGGAFITLYTIAPRFLLGLSILALWLRRDLLDINAGEWRRGIIIALFGAGGMILQNDGLRFTHASTSAFLTQFYAILIPVWFALRRREVPPPLIWVCCTLVLAGVSILGGVDFRQFGFGRGEAETLFSSVFFMAQILWVERAGREGDRPVKLTTVIFIVLGGLNGLLAAITAPRLSALATPWTDPGWLVLTAQLAVFATVGSFLIMMTWQPKISATEAGIVYCTEPVFAALLALFLPAIYSRWAGIEYSNERFTVSLVVGGALITAANLLLQLNHRDAKEL